MGFTMYFIGGNAVFLRKTLGTDQKIPDPFKKGLGLKGSHFSQRLSLSFTPAGGVPGGTPFGCLGAAGTLDCPTCGGAIPIFLCIEVPVGAGVTGLFI
jgi:hypothetical protein